MISKILKALSIKTTESIKYTGLMSLSIALLMACNNAVTSPNPSGVGANPSLPPPKQNLIPTVNIAKAIGWPENTKPVAMSGIKVEAFAKDLDHPRWLYVLPNGDVLVAESNAPKKSDDEKSIKSWAMGLVMKRAGSATPSANRISLLRDTNADGVADLKTTFLAGLNSPFGMALVNNNLYVANTDAILRFPYTTGATAITEAGIKLVSLPAGTINHHWTKNIIASRDGKYLYATVGSNSNIAERGMEVEKERAAILKVDISNGNYRVYASGLRNPNGMAWESKSDVLWTVVNERDELGNDLVPDYLTSVTDGGFYGWPYSYFGQHIDSRVTPTRPDLVAKALVPDYGLGAHTAPLGLADATGNKMGFSNGMFIGLHGSWNRKPRSGYKVIFVPFDHGKPNGMPVDVLHGFVSESEKAYGRPVGVAIDGQGGLLVADDVGNCIWHLSGSITKIITK